MKHIKKIIFIIFLFILIFFMYKLFSSNKLTYLSLGDSLAKGKNAFSTEDIGYSDYVAQYLNKNDRLRFYSKDYAKEGYRITDVLNDIKLNKKIKVGNDCEGLKSLLRKSNLLTLSIGSNDILYKINNDIENTSIEELNLYIDELIIDYNNLLEEINKYFKGKLIIIGYYNPYIYQEEEKNNLEEPFIYINNKMNTLAKKYNAEYISIYEIFTEHPEYLPNPKNIHPSKEGYKQISNLIIEKIK